jgi:AcrR family transcriptional regulator
MGPRALRTSALILDSAREVFLAKGYFGTKIDNIVDAAGISRASFYTYFPSKRDLLLQLGNRSYKAMDTALDDMQRLETGWTRESAYAMVRIYLRFLDEHGAFLLVWAQAIFDDEEMGRAGMNARLTSGRRFGQMLERLSGKRPNARRDPARTGLALMVMIDRYWAYWRVNGFPFSEEEVVETLGDIILAVIDAG